MRAVGRLLAGPAAQVRVDGAALDRAGADQGHLDHQVVEAARPEPGQGGHLSAGLDLEDAHRIGLAEHLVDTPVVVRDTVQVVALAVVPLDQVAGVVQGGEHAEAEQVDLDEPGTGRGVLVPLQDGPAGHPGPLGGADLADRRTGEHHAA